MNKQQFWNQLLLFILLFLSVLGTREYFSHQLIANNITSYQAHMVFGTSINILLILISYFFIKKNGLLTIAGIKGSKLKKWPLLLFPLYLVLLNALIMDEIQQEIFIGNLLLLLMYSLSIGVAEELSIRGFLQSHLISYFGKTKKQVVLSIFMAALFFGLLHLINFNKGLYGELSQLFFAMFIGVMFGVLLVITKRIYPLIIIHAIIDFVAKLDANGLPIKEKIRASMSVENALLIVLLTSPCLLYGLYLMKKNKLVEAQ